MKNGKAIGNDAIGNEMIKCYVQTRFVDVVRDLRDLIAILTKPISQNYGKLITSLQFSKVMMPSIPITTEVLQLTVALVNYSLSLLMKDWLNF